MAQPMLFEPISIRDVTLKNRVVVAPMHQYSAVKGFATDWHLMNAGRYAAGGAGLVIMESTKVERRGCGTVGDLGIWDDAFIPGLKRCVEFIRQHNSVPGIQLGHSGPQGAALPARGKGGAPLKPQPEIDDWEQWELVSSSAKNAPETDPTPRALTRDEIPQVDRALGPGGAARATEAGFDVLDIHAAHGYLIHQVPLAVLQRAQRRLRRQRAQPHALLHRSRRNACAPTGRPASRCSCASRSRTMPAGDPTRAWHWPKILKPKGVDVIDCSSGGMRGSPVVSAGPVTYGYQVPYAERLRRDADIMSMAVGLIVHADQAEQILQEGRADLIALARELLYNPNWPMDAAQKLGVDRQFGSVPPAQAYWLAKRAQSVKSVVPSTFMKGMNAE
jgi:2,4-dienoyl-CoA reductase-like NADH-dependent reductase (Old Yellow Enzyme family)